jgi:2-polyprenyl-3-methyl-5-hydroxy-6-metoxy-1,4-benzoquinol methylase
MEQKLDTSASLSDQVGYETLDSIAQAGRFNQWMFQTVAAYTRGEVLEIGSGIGNISAYFVKNNRPISVSDMRPEYCKFLKKKFSGMNSFREVHQIDIVDPGFDTKHKDLMGKFDSVIALNIVEHVEDDEYAIRNCLKLLKQGGQLVILVPAFMWLYNRFDTELGHYRRYTRKSLKKLFLQSNLTTDHIRYFNFIGILGWWFSGSLLKKKTIPSGQMKLYDALVWVFKRIDVCTHPWAGLSVIATAQKQ